MKPAEMLIRDGLGAAKSVQQKSVQQKGVQQKARAWWPALFCPRLVNLLRLRHRRRLLAGLQIAEAVL